MQFIHLISQIILSTSTPQDSREERYGLLPAGSVLSDILNSLCNEMVKQVPPETLKQEILSDKGSKANKLLVYKFFFFNYLLQVSGDEVVTACLEGKANPKLLPNLVHAMLVIIQVLEGRKINMELDASMRPSKLPNKDPNSPDDSSEILPDEEAALREKL